MKKYTEQQLNYLLNLKHDVVENHKSCNGSGYIKKTQEQCICMKIFTYLSNLYYSQIPIDYWELDLNQLSVKISYKKFINDFINNIDNALKQGLGIVFMGDKGVGKTSLMCEVGKYAIANRYSVFYEVSQNIVDDRFTETKEKTNRIMNSHLVIIDELERIMMRKESNIPTQVYNLLKSLLPNRRSVLIGTNLENEDDIDNKFDTSSLMNRNLEFLHIDGEDYSDKKRERWLERLKRTEVNYFCDNIKKMANIFYKNREKEYERERVEILEELNT